jgi:WhiB family redox-sensing transcriptional regulator
VAVSRSTQVRSIARDFIHIFDLGIPAEPWRAGALCAQTDPEAFFPEKGGSTREAKAVCGRCTVSAECLDYALENQERYGIWGGHSERERRKLARLLFPTAQPEDPSNEDLDNHLETA